MAFAQCVTPCKCLQFDDWLTTDNTTELHTDCYLLNTLSSPTFASFENKLEILFTRAEIVYCIIVSLDSISY